MPQLTLRRSNMGRETLSQHYHRSLSVTGAFEIFELDNKFLLHRNLLYGSINFTAIHDNICVISTPFLNNKITNRVLPNDKPDSCSL